MVNEACQGFRFMARQSRFMQRKLRFIFCGTP
jgi:hypothetical protein